MERLQYVSPEYQQQLEDLADTLMASKRQQLADAALQDTVEFPPVQDTLFDPDQLEG